MGSYRPHVDSFLADLQTHRHEPSHRHMSSEIPQASCSHLSSGPWSTLNHVSVNEYCQTDTPLGCIVVFDGGRNRIFRSLRVSSVNPRDHIRK